MVRLTADAVLFDVDDTLVDFETAAMLALADAVRPYLAVEPNRLAAAWRTINDAQYGRYLRGELEFDDMRNARMAALLTELVASTGRDRSAELAEPPVLAGPGIALESGTNVEPGAAVAPGTARPATTPDHRVIEAARHGAIFGHYRLFPDARPCISRLRSAGMPVGIVTNSDGDHQRRKLIAVGLPELAESAICSGDVGVAKPDSRIFAIAAEQLGVQPGRVVYVGDRWSTDALGALRAGLGAVWLNRHGRRRPVLDPAWSDPTVGRLFAEIGSLDELDISPCSPRPRRP